MHWNNKRSDIMENTQNQNDIYNFFKDMPTNQQQEAISKLNRQIKKPPDSKPVEIEQVELTDIFVGQ